MLREGDGEEKILDQGELWRLILSTAMCGFDFLPILQASEAENGQESGAPTSPEEEVHFAACGTRHDRRPAWKWYGDLGLFLFANHTSHDLPFGR